MVKGTIRMNITDKEIRIIYNLLDHTLADMGKKDIEDYGLIKEEHIKDIHFNNDEYNTLLELKKKVNNYLLGSIGNNKKI